MPQARINIINIKTIIVTSIKCQKTELSNLKPILDTQYTRDKNHVHDINDDIIKNGSVVYQNIFAFFLLLIVWSITVQNIKTFP